MSNVLKYKRLEFDISNLLEKELILNSKFNEIVTEGYKIHTYNEYFEPYGDHSHKLRVVILCEKLNDKNKMFL